MPAVGGEPVHAVVVLVHHVGVVFGVEGQARGAVHLSGPTAMLAPLSQEPARQVEDRYPVVVLVGDEHALPAVKGYGSGQPELAVGVSAGPELVQEFLVPAVHPHPRQAENHRAPVQDQDTAILGERQVHRVGEPAAKWLAADAPKGLDVFQ